MQQKQRAATYREIAPATEGRHTKNHTERNRADDKARATKSACPGTSSARGSV